MTRRDFIKGMGALALIPFIPEMVRPEPKVYGVSPAQAMLPDIREMNRMLEDALMFGDHEPKWDNTGTMTIPTREGRYKVRYTVNQDGTEAEIVGEE